MHDDEVEHFELFLIGGADDEKASFELIENRDSCRINCEHDGEAFTAEARDFFDAFQGVRRWLNKRGLIPFCYGASLNVWPSGMSRDMGLGLKAYKTQVGVPATELVRIFEDGPDVIPANVEAQEQFHNDWINSLRR
jgi:hypothetical protein